MESPGKYLKKERESRNLNLEEVSKSTRIKKHILRAIEEDRYDLCPPPFYVKGFLTNYARCLGLDPKDIILKYQELIKSPVLPMKAVLLEQPRESFRFRPRIQTRIGARVLLLSAFLISLIIPLYIYHGYVYRPLKAPDLPVLSRQKLPTSAATPEKENPPVIHQINQIELLGPKEVQAEPFYKISEAHLGTGIELEGSRLTVVGRGSEFRCENQKVYFYTRIMTPREGKIYHVWRWEGEEFHRIGMVVKSPEWSVYSYITLPPARSGNWKVEVWDGEKILTHLDFKAHQPNLLSPLKKESST